MRELTIQEIEKVVAGDCNYAGQSYSVGAVISNPAGGFLECTMSNNGDYWSRFMM